MTGLIVFAVAALVTAGLTLVWRSRQVRRMEQDAVALEWTWAGFSRWREGETVVRGPGARAVLNGPVGVLWFDGQYLSWRPVASLRRRGYVERSWRADEVRIASDVRRRLLSGEVIREIEVYLGGIRVRIIIYKEAGDWPAVLTSLAS